MHLRGKDGNSINFVSRLLGSGTVVLRPAWRTMHLSTPYMSRTNIPVDGFPPLHSVKEMKYASKGNSEIKVNKRYDVEKDFTNAARTYPVLRARKTTKPCLLSDGAL